MSKHTYIRRKYAATPFNRWHTVRHWNADLSVTTECGLVFVTGKVATYDAAYVKNQSDDTCTTKACKKGMSEDGIEV